MVAKGKNIETFTYCFYAEFALYNHLFGVPLCIHKPDIISAQSELSIHMRGSGNDNYHRPQRKFDNLNHWMKLNEFLIF